MSCVYDWWLVQHAEIFYWCVSILQIIWSRWVTCDIHIARAQGRKWFAYKLQVSTLRWSYQIIEMIECTGKLCGEIIGDTEKYLLHEFFDNLDYLEKKRNVIHDIVRILSMAFQYFLSSLKFQHIYTVHVPSFTEQIFTNGWPWVDSLDSFRKWNMPLWKIRNKEIISTK